MDGSGRSYRLTGNSAFTKATSNAMTEVLDEGMISAEEYERTRQEILKEL